MNKQNYKVGTALTPIPREDGSIPTGCAFILDIKPLPSSVMLRPDMYNIEDIEDGNYYVVCTDFGNKIELFRSELEGSYYAMNSSTGESIKERLELQINNLQKVLDSLV
jgi:hypothetical protein